MNWRKKIKGGFESIESIEHKSREVVNIKNIKNNNIYKVSKGYLEKYTHNTQNPQNTQNPEKETKNTRMVKTQSTPEKTPAQNIPAPEPAGLGPEYESLWNAAWKLADFIDNPDGAPYEERRARLPELDRLRAEMVEIERQAVPTAPMDPEGTWTPWAGTPATKERTAGTCPAQCKRTGKCYGKAYFEGKPGPFPGPECEPNNCERMKK